MGKYVYKDTVFYLRKFEYNNYRVEYELFEKDGTWNASVLCFEDSAEPVLFRDLSRRECANLLKAWFKEVVDEDRVKLFMRKGFRIYPVFDDVLYSAREKLVGYHVSSTANREGILAKGLVPNGNPEQAVMLASKVIDNVKPPQIPEWVVRQDAVYAHPAMGNDVLMGGHYKNCDLYALFLPRERCWVGSQAIGGFCLIFDEVEGEKLTEQIKKAKKEAKLYWKYSCSLEDYLSNTEEFQKKDKAYGLDEILIMRPIPPSDLFLIGSWDEEGTFHETSDFKRFVKHEFKDSYRDILEKYKL